MPRNGLVPATKRGASFRSPGGPGTLQILILANGDWGMKIKTESDGGNVPENA